MNSIKEMLSEIIMEIDYDVWKEYELEPEGYDPLVDIVKSYLTDLPSSHHADCNCKECK